MAKLNVITSDIEGQVKAKNPGATLRVLRYERAEFIIKPASPLVYQRFIDEISDKDTRPIAARALVAGCVVYPEEKEFGSILEQQPGLISVLADDCATFSGAKAASEKKDL